MSANYEPFPRKERRPLQPPDRSHLASPPRLTERFQIRSSMRGCDRASIVSASPRFAPSAESPFPKHGC